jgi:hypothetical protein
MGHDLPMENDPFAFSRALCSLTRPVLRTEIMTMRAFLFEAGAVGGAGDCGYEPSSWTRMWVMYDSWTAMCQRDPAKPSSLEVLAVGIGNTNAVPGRRPWRSSSR